MEHMVICIGRQYGSGGREIGERLAQKLGINCYDKLLIKKAAEISGLNEEYISREEEAERLSKLDQKLSPLERKIMALFLYGLSYREISEQMGRPIKSVDNAIQRIRRKVAGDFGVISES